MDQRNALYVMLLGVVAAVGGALVCLGYVLDNDAPWKIAVQALVAVMGVGIAVSGYRAWSKPDRNA
jgi:hypothetical protein